MTSDRLKEIRARLEDCVEGYGEGHIPSPEEILALDCEIATRSYPLLHHAPADIAWLLDEVDNLKQRIENLEGIAFTAQGALIRIGAKRGMSLNDMLDEFIEAKNG